MNYNNIPLMDFHRVYMQPNQEATFTFSKISDNMNYTLYFIITSDDPSANAIHSAVVRNLTFQLD
jgi:hypothetical protein